MGGKPLECGMGADGGEVDEIDEAESPEDRVEREALEAEMKRKFPKKEIEEEFFGGEGSFPDDVGVVGDLSARVQLLKQFTQRRVGRGCRNSVVVDWLRWKKRHKKLLLAPADFGEGVGVAGKNRPRERVDCVNGQRPCLWVGCKYHLYLDVNSDTGSVKYNFPGLEVDELPVSCALDVADAGGLKEAEVAVLLNVTSQAINLILWRAVDKIVDSPLVRELRKLFRGELGF